MSWLDDVRAAVSRSMRSAVCGVAVIMPHAIVWLLRIGYTSKNLTMSPQIIITFLVMAATFTKGAGV